MVSVIRIKIKGKCHNRRHVSYNSSIMKTQYRKPDYSNYMNFVSTLSDKISNLNSNSKILLAGDFNSILFNVDIVM